MGGKTEHVPSLNSVPQGRPKIAHRFNGGKARRPSRPSPGGAKEWGRAGFWRRGPGSFVPPGLGLIWGAKPSDESLGYGRSSRRDWPTRAAAVQRKNCARSKAPASRAHSKRGRARRNAPPTRRVWSAASLLPLSVRAIPPAGCVEPVIGLNSVPQGRPTIAHRFNGGKYAAHAASPKGAKKSDRVGFRRRGRVLSSLRDSALFGARNPAMNRWAILGRPCGTG